MRRELDQASKKGLQGVARGARREKRRSGSSRVIIGRNLPTKVIHRWLGGRTRISDYGWITRAAASIFLSDE